ncbi:hypothetical protein SRHO_G00082870 [Serrasalmus rhombeus]
MQLHPMHLYTHVAGVKTFHNPKPPPPPRGCCPVQKVNSHDATQSGSCNVALYSQGGIFQLLPAGRLVQTPLQLITPSLPLLSPNEVDITRSGAVGADHGVEWGTARKQREWLISSHVCSSFISAQQSENVDEVSMKANVKKDKEKVSLAFLKNLDKS